MGLLLWPLLVFAYYKQKHRLQFWLWFFIILGSIPVILGSGEAVGLAIFVHIIGLPIFWLSARFTAWCIHRYVKKRKGNT